jgi:hypothetical protein
MVCVEKQRKGLKFIHFFSLLFYSMHLDFEHLIKLEKR